VTFPAADDSPAGIYGNLLTVWRGNVGGRGVGITAGTMAGVVEGGAFWEVPADGPGSAPALPCVVLDPSVAPALGVAFVYVGDVACSADAPPPAEDALMLP
jgi:hypothetical protein